jgi:hypothetical protein
VADERAQQVKRIEGLREKIAEEQARQAAAVSDVADELHGKQLDAEEANLQAQLAELKARGGTKSAIKEGTANLTEAAKEEKQAAEQHAEAQKASRRGGNR